MVLGEFISRPNDTDTALLSSAVVGYGSVESDLSLITKDFGISSKLEKPERKAIFPLVYALFAHTTLAGERTPTPSDWYVSTDRTSRTVVERRLQ